MNEKSPVIPEVLYHYTDAAGLVAILQSKQLWASHARSMNDLQELHAGLKIAKEMLHEAHAPGAMHLRLHESMCKWNSWEREDSYFICCFTDQADSLDMWRGYLLGFNIGFAITHCDQAVLQYDSNRIANVIYLEDEFRARVASVLSIENPLEGEAINAELFRLSALFKHHAWQNEREWRLVTTRRGWGSERKFRAGRYGVAPYVEVPFEDESQVFGLEVKSVTVGPGPFQRDSSDMAQYMLRCVGFGGVTVRISDVPLR